MMSDCTIPSKLPRSSSVGFLAADSVGDHQAAFGCKSLTRPRSSTSLHPCFEFNSWYPDKGSPPIDQIEQRWKRPRACHHCLRTNLPRCDIVAVAHLNNTRIKRLLKITFSMSQTDILPAHRVTNIFDMPSPLKSREIYIPFLSLSSFSSPGLFSSRCHH